jgi:hypothetical protein
MRYVTLQKLIENFQFSISIRPIEVILHDSGKNV